ncbi:hypothetical protein J2X19_001773 [Rhodoferax ferrireducens]|uniref:Peptidoglycan binding-like domain-containing protein n=1 Tax=Rhodoferax ferrireducens TaxID=192843 RepID=A0ABU2C714_9BURK|nr:hypothetical protein [Rhodoferax ferrireducens]MDR7377115.1 hypothetical protein [Rhodoferax ferrireducens]
MENSIIDIVLGLALIYLALSLLISSAQEMVSGAFFKGRQATLHDLLYEATGQDDALKQRVLANPLVFALYRGGVAHEGIKMWRRASGPVEVPPDIFARALLTEVNQIDPGKHPSDRYASPLSFLDALKDKGLDKDGTGERKVVGALRALVVGRETDWGGFEAAIAAWFEYIGDRSTGWFKRSATIWTFWLSLCLALALNVDSFHIARVLGSDAELRVGLADLAERFIRTEQQGSTTPVPAQAPAPAKPEVMATARLMDAYNRLAPLFDRDENIGRFERRLQPVRESCGIVAGLWSDKVGSKANDRASKVGDKFISDAGAWLEVIPAMIPYIDMAIAGYVPPPSPTRPGTPGSTAPATGTKSSVQPASAVVAAVSKPSTSPAPVVAATAAGSKSSTPPAPVVSAVGTEPPAQPASAVSAPEKPADVSQAKQVASALRAAHTCVSHISTWVGAASTASNDAAVQTAMQAAAVALKDSQAALETLMKRSKAPEKLQRLFKSDPEEFNQCALTASSLEEVRTCMETDNVWTRLPFGYSSANLNNQFCSVRSAATLAETNAKPGLFFCLDSDENRVNPRSEIGLPAMRLHSRGFMAYVSWLAGILVTTFFVCLGAPVWFDVLSKFVKLRVAGRMEDRENNAAKANGTLPLLPPSKPAPTSSTPSTNPSPTPSATPYEAELSRREIIALQQRLGVSPETGELDDATRLKLRAKLGGSDVLTSTTYTELVGRPPMASSINLASAASRPRVRQAHPQVPVLANKLMVALDFPARVASTERAFNDDLRALTVLYRYKKAATQAERDTLLALARDNPSTLDELDEELMNEILQNVATFPRSVAPWMDWVLGELGQVEVNASSRKSSNPRICEYLDAVATSYGDKGDTTPWCGAFAAWVVTRYNAEATARTALPPFPLKPNPPPTPTLAHSWTTWGKARPRNAAVVGDIVVVKIEKDGDAPGVKSGFHVGWCLTATTQSVNLLGGNQSHGGRVCISTFSKSDIVHAGF